MWEHSPSVRDAVGADAYAPRQVLDEATLRALHDANRSFLTHAVALLGGSGRLGYLPAVLALAPGARSVAAECPYTLFNLRFQDGAFWRSVHAETRPSLSVPPAVAGFGRAAVFLAWHLVRSRELAAPIALGMVPPVVAVWRALPLSALDHVAGIVLPYVTARWAGHERFWSALARAAGAGHQSQLTEVRLLGMQLLAAEGVRARARPEDGAA